MKVYTLFFSELGESDWYRFNYLETFDLSHKTVNDCVERIDGSKISLQEFIERYEKPYKPVVITNIQKHWRGNEKWTQEV